MEGVASVMAWLPLIPGRSAVIYSLPVSAPFFLLIFSMECNPPDTPARRVQRHRDGIFSSKAGSQQAGGAGRTPDCKASQEQIVTIRAKIISLIASFIAAIVLVVAFMAYRAYQDSYQMAVSSSKSLVQSVTNYVALFFKTAGDNSLFLANLRKRLPPPETCPPTWTWARPKCTAVGR